jgi:succinoglycan biosynthesis transport protein ExoP
MEDRQKIYSDKEHELIDITTLLGDMIKAVQYHKVRFLVIILACMVLFCGYRRITYVQYYEAYKTYTISASISAESSNMYLDNETANQMAKTFPYILKSDILMDVVKKDLGVKQIPGEISADVMDETNLFTLKVSSKDPKMAEKILKSVVKNYPSVAQYVIGSSHLELLDESGVPTKPMNPFQYKREALLGALIGMGICFVLILIYAFTRKTIHKEEDLKKILNVPTIGILPRVRFKKSSKQQNELVLLGNQKISAGFLESTRSIRTRLERISREKGMKSFLVTSAMPGEGKSTVSANIALSLAAKGKSVILVDADLRNPSTAKVFGVTKERQGNGTLDVLTGKVSYQKALVPYKNTTVKLLLGSKAIADTASVLSQDTMKSFIKELEKRADYVIIDTPPSGLLSDAAIVGQYVQGAIFVVREDYTWIDRIIEGTEILAASGVQIVGSILNDASATRSKHGYSEERREYKYRGIRKKENEA